ncbi:MAG: NAD(P)H-dependent oxidoreductase [Thermohalobaculum sp.]|nr:NAD(P)H-dependent oxidoreductase [Thermohalobaculum sp.]
MKIAVIVGHPRKGSFCEALGDAYAQGAREAGREVEVIRLAELSFDPILHGGYGGDQPLEPDLSAAQAAIGAARHSVWIWPMWFGSAPALMKGFIERVFQMGWAAEKIPGPPWYRPLLTGRSARVIVTMQMPVMVYRLVAGARSARTFSKQILEHAGIKPTRRTYFGMVDISTPEQRARWLDEVQALGRRGI